MSAVRSDSVDADISIMRTQSWWPWGRPLCLKLAIHQTFKFVRVSDFTWILVILQDPDIMVYKL